MNSPAQAISSDRSWQGMVGGRPLDTVSHALRRAVQSFPDNRFLDMAGESFTFGEVDARATRFANSLISLGMGKGDRLVSLLETNIDVFTCWFACSKIGAIWVPINLAYRGEFLRHQISDSDPRIIVCDDAYLERVLEIKDALPPKLILLAKGALRAVASGLDIRSFEAFRGDDETALPVSSEPQDTALIIYTSGTTGPSKGCMIGQNQLCHIGQQHLRSVPHGPGEKAFTCLPLFHVAALYSVLSALLSGNEVAIWPRFSVSRFWEDIEQSGATNALLIASIFPLVAHAPDTPAMERCRSQLHTVTGIPIPPEIRRIWHERFGVRRLNSFTYGQTEGSKLSMVSPEDKEPPLDSAGRIAEEFDVRIFDDNDREVPDGTIGEIVWRPKYPHISFQGYWRQPEATVRVWRNMWMHTGDLGMFEGGYLFFKDRKKDYLRARGENISSYEVEAAFSSHPDVLDVAVHAVGEQTGEDEIKATIVLRDCAELDEKALCLWAIENLPHFAVPRYFEFRADLPRNPTGKILKYALRDEGITSATWDRSAEGIDVRRR